MILESYSAFFLQCILVLNGILCGSIISVVRLSIYPRMRQQIFCKHCKINNKIFISFGPTCTDTIKKGFAGLHELEECMKHKG